MRPFVDGACTRPWDFFDQRVVDDQRGSNHATLRHELLQRVFA
jgi:hypothetical protein